MAELTTPVTEVMRRKPVTVNALDDQELVAKKIAKYNLLAVPVLEKDGSVVGFVTVDDVIDVLVEEQTEDILRMAGVEPGALDKPYFDNPISRVVRKRIGWLLLLFVAGTMTSAVLHRFEDELATVVALSFFIPLLIGTGGNAGAQTVMTVIRSLALGEIGIRHAWRVVLREASTGMIVGLLVAPIAFGQALLWKYPSRWRHRGGYDAGDLSLVNDGRSFGSDRCRTVRGGSGRPFCASDYHARRCDWPGNLFLDRKNHPATDMNA